MNVPFLPCPCCTSATPSHAVLTVGPDRIKVPWEHRHDPVGWGDGHVLFGDKQGWEKSRGTAGITALDAEGNEHQIPHGGYRRRGKAAPEALTAMMKAALKAGQRWITVHPNGDDGHGVPILIQQEPDGTHRVIGGAGGKLTHLRLKNVKDPGDTGDAKEKAKAAREKEKERIKALPPEQREKEKSAKEDVKKEKKAAERAFVEKVRSQIGGVSADLDDEKLQDTSPAAAAMLRQQHHRKQVAEAQRVVKEASQKLVASKIGEETTSRALEHAGEEAPAQTEQARTMAEEELQLRAQEEEERRIERRTRTARVTTGAGVVSERGLEHVVQAIEAAPDPKTILRKHGGRDDAGNIEHLRHTLTASEELERRAAQSIEDAKILVAVARGEKPTDAVAQRVYQKALEATGATEEDPEGLRVALLKEAQRKQTRAEVVSARAERFKEVEASKEEGGEEAAQRMLAFSDMFSGVASSAATARKLGLTATEQAPLQEPEAAAIADVLKSAAELRQKRKAFEQMNRQIETGDYDRSRRAFDLNVQLADEQAQAGVEEEIRRDLAQRLVGMGSRKLPAHMQAVANGHYDGLADAGLGIARQRFIGRPTVDAIGVGNAAVLMRFAMEQAGHDPKTVLDALEKHHISALTKTSTDALARADKYVPGFTAKVSEVGDIEQAIGHLDAHHQDIEDAQRAVGSALGRLEATATLGQTFRGKLPQTMEIKAPNNDIKGSLGWLHSVGLQPGDYRIDYKAGKITIPQTSWSKMLDVLPESEVKARQVAEEIKSGKMDEQGWLPPGIVRRAQSTFMGLNPEEPRIFHPLELRSSDWKGSLEDHVGARLADGEQPHEILHDLLAPVNTGAASDPDAYTEAVRALFPMQDEEGRSRKYSDMKPHFDALSEKYMQKRYGTTTGAFHAQDLEVDSKDTHEALFRTLAEHPHAATAFKGTGQLDHQDQRVLREHFYKKMGLDPKARGDVAAFQRELGAIGPEPSRTAGTMSLFGGFGGGSDEPTPEYREWAAKRDAVLSKYPREGLEEAIKAAGGDEMKLEAAKRAAAEAPSPWGRFVGTHGSLELAQKALQDEIKGDFLHRFQHHYGLVTGKGLKSGKAEVANRERHLLATGTPDEVAEFNQRKASLYAKLRKREGGQFAGEGEGALLGKVTRHLEQATIDTQNQGFLFGAKQLPKAPEKSTDLEKGERFSLGERAESQIASLMPAIGGQFEPGKGVNLFPGLNMDGPRATQQRAIKLLDHTGRLGAWLGTGSGKSLTSIGAFTLQHDKGTAKQGLYLVPSAVQEQFGGEMLRYTEPGKYRWATGDGKNHEQRVAMLKNPDLHMKVMTHQSFRETALKVMAEHHKMTPEAMEEELVKSPPKLRAQWMRQAFDAAGIPRHFTYLDEAHMATQRDVDPSRLSMIMNAATHPMNATHALLGTATPHKNDEAEVYSMASMLDPDRYADKHEFMQSFGSDLAFNPDAIRRELGHLTMSARVDPEGVDRIDTDNPEVEPGRPGLFGGGTPARKIAHQGPLPLLPEHKALVDKVDAAYNKAVRARNSGSTDVEAIKALSPRRFEGAPEEEHAKIAADLVPNLGMIRDHALRRAINRAPAEINTKLQALTKVLHHDLRDATWVDRKGNEHKGKPSIVFTDSAEEARMIHEHLQKQGIRASLYHGGLTPDEKERARLGYQPEAADEDERERRATSDVMVMTAAGEAGINLQRAKVIHHFDVPQTEKSHTQRTGRAYRQGQQGDVDVHNWHTEHPFEQNALRRVRRKGDLGSVFQTPISNLDDTGIAMEYQRALARRHEAQEAAA